MNVRIGIPIACFCALSLAICAEPTAGAQAPGPVSQPAGVAAQDTANDLVVAEGKSMSLWQFADIAAIGRRCRPPRNAFGRG